MLKLTVFITVITASILGEIHCKQSSNVDVQSLLQSLQKQMQIEDLQKVRKESQLDYDDDADVYGTLRSDEVEQLINLAKDDSDKSYDNQYKVNDENQLDTDNKLLQQLNLLQNLQDTPQSLIKERIYNNNQIDTESKLLQQLNLLQNLLNRPLKLKKERKVAKNFLPNNLLAYNDGKDLLLDVNNKDDDNNDSNDDGNDIERNYSNIYLVLNPDAVEKSQNKDKLNELLTELLQPNQRVKERQEPRYKGFVIKNNDYLNRRRGNRDEDIYGKDSMEGGGYKKRNRERGDHGGGGGGSGRTAIPYIRHRGDIYEKDN